MTSTNAFNKFKAMVGGTSTDVVTIVSNNGDGTSTATTLSGATIVVKGETVTATNKAFIRGGEIIRQAPNHTVSTLGI